ncbi:alpha/beta fold hydrolase [Paenarthrobacter sp. NPDC089675]|uniref:alpha/beta fold hydrolase n=1 Tax=Paenarthrobacter sp. NPDC089675 TaxID=3364376 RepID=UPI00380CE9B1
MESGVRTVRLRTGVTVQCFVRGRVGKMNDEGGAPLLLLHAWGESWRSFTRLIAALPSATIVAPDLRGHGGADKPGSGYSLVEVSEDVTALSEHLCVRRAHVLGSSSGGYVAQQLAVLHPELVQSLMLVGAPLSLEGKPPFGDELEQLRDPVTEAWVRRSLSWYQLLHTVPPDYIEDRVQDGMSIPADVWRASLRGLCEAAPPTQEGRISVPTLIIRGAHDHLVPRSHQEALAQRIPGAVLRTYEDTGHLVLWECPERVAEDVRDFVGLSIRK